ncbi:MAG: cytochrome c family protein [Alphaproteobacteria bacterium]
MENLENNKIFAAVLTAGVVAGLAGFGGKLLVSPDMPEVDAFPVEVTDAVGGGPVKPAGPDPVLGLLAEADVDNGQKLTRACVACHSFDQGGPHKTGPNLWQIIGREKASVDGVRYSSALSAMEGPWTYANLNHFLWKPKDYVKGTSMGYAGMKKVSDRADMIAYLRTLSDSPADLPDEAAIQAESGVEEEAAAPTDASVETPAETSEEAPAEAPAE